MLIVHGRANSVNVQPVVWCLAELGVPFERLDVGGPFGGTDTPEYRAMNPMGLVPTLTDAGQSLSESAAILRYIMRKYGNHPTDPMAAAQIERWGDMCRSHVYPHLLPVIFWQLYRTTKEDRNHAAIASAAAALKVAMTAFANQTKGNLFGGDAPNLADYQFGCLLFRYYGMDFERADLPALDDYYAALSDRKAYQQHIMLDFASLKIPGA
ncbi:glutathione S-transferase family protein [Roseibium sediminis]|uniref:glutathione S-transferase family protein n=1 Tax=Roseibium sediminis TaxID=1775174 RepID=UPI00123DB810|nr:glutathione S-transferase N-terminal domain-containing protein [Roseibium sediminis]